MISKRVLCVLSLLLCLGLAGCEQTKIGDILADPGSHMKTEINVVGTVTNSMGVLGKGFYQIDDGTGKLWVVVDSRGVPSRGTRVAVKGRILPSITILGTNYVTALHESDRHSEKAGN